MLTFCHSVIICKYLSAKWSKAGSMFHIQGLLRNADLNHWQSETLDKCQTGGPRSVLYIMESLSSSDGQIPNQISFSNLKSFSK